MIRLYIYRTSQASTLIEAIQDGSIRYIDTFENTSVGDVAKLDAVKSYIEITSECLDACEEIVFIEESVT